MSGPPVYSFRKKVSDVIPRNGLVAEYLANNNALDTSGNGYDGLPTDITFGPDRHGTPNSAFVVNGSSSFVNIDAALAGLSTNTLGAWSFWIKPVDATPLGTADLITFGDTNFNEHLTTQQRTDAKIRGINVINNGLKWRLTTDNAELLDDTWVHLLLNHIGSATSLYVDGVLVDQTVDGISAPGTTWFNDSTGIDNGRVGCRNNNSNGNTSFFNGLIDDIRLYDRDLSQAERTALANE